MGSFIWPLHEQVGELFGDLRGGGYILIRRSWARAAIRNITYSAFPNIVTAFSFSLTSSAPLLLLMHEESKDLKYILLFVNSNTVSKVGQGKTCLLKPQTLHTKSKAGFSSTVVSLGRIMLSEMQFKTCLLNPYYVQSPEEIRPSISGPAWKLL